MPPIGPIKRIDLIRTMRALDFTGPHEGGKQVYGTSGWALRSHPKSSHHEEIETGLLTRILREAGISREQWERR